MSNRVFFVSIAAAFVATLLIVSHRMSRNAQRAFEAAARAGLESFYVKLLSEQEEGTNLNSFTAETVMLALRDEFSRPNRCFPGFVKPEDVAVSATVVPGGRTNLLCAIELSKRVRYGLAGNGRCRLVSRSEYESWPHQKYDNNWRCVYLLSRDPFRSSHTSAQDLH